MADYTASENAKRMAAKTLDVLATPIKGVPSIRVAHRANAIRLLAAAFSAAFEPESQAAEGRDE